MYWGSLLGIGDVFSGAIDGIKEAVYQVGSFFGQILYSIWRLLAWVIDQIELVFSSLAGLDTQGGEDLVSKIINNKSVQAILSNMIAISMVIIVFFTIIKILQDHYKEKDGGNPYKVVISTFKGMLMFFFVGIAVTVGIQAAGVFLRGLDAATSGGSTTLSGQVFKAMAADANRKRKGKDGDGGFFADVANKYWSRTSSEGGIEHGKYAMVQMKDNGQTKTQADLLKIYEELCPEYKYGIVGSDGKVTPLNPSILSLFKDSLSTQDVGAELGSDVEKWYGTGEKVEYDNDTEFGDGSGEVTAGYKNDIFQAVTLNIKPSINLTWSPVDIVTSYYEMMADGDPVAWDLNVTFLGTGFNLSFMIEKVKYFKTSEIKKSLEDSAKQFGISINASAGLQDGEVSASFKLDMFDPAMFFDLLASILVNVVYTNMMQFMVEAIPSMYVRYVIGPVTINLLQLFGPLIFDCTETVMNNSFGKLIPTVKEKDEETGELVVKKDDEGNEIRMVQAFAHNESSHNGGVWVNANSKSPNIPLSIEKYIVDGNFEELWSQLTDNWNQFVEQMETSAEAAYDQFDENVQQIEDANLRGQEQADWQSYKALVDEYNDYAVGYLGQLGKLLSLFETALLSAQISAEDYVANEDKLNAILPILGYSGNMKSLEADIQEVFTYLVASYNESVSSRANRVPRGSYADAIYTQSLYKPIIEFPNYSTKIAETMDLYEIRNALIKENNKVKVNMFAEKTSDGGYNTVRQIDWKNYGPKFSQKFGKDKPIADLYYVEDADGDSNPDNANTPTSRLKKDSKTVVYFTTMDGYETWDQSDGLSYFYNDENPDSPFLKYEGQKDGTGSDIYLATGYWGDRGLTVEGDRYYQAYTGTALDNTNKNNCWDGKSTYEGSSTASLSTRSSSARVNSALQANRAATMKEISTFADVSEEKSELAKEFAKNIITFRPLDSESSSDDVKVLKDWCEPKDTATLSGKFDTYMLPTIEAERIDDLMAMGGGLRNYLMLTPEGTSEPDNGTFKSFVGFFSYSDPRTVKALYEMGDINYAVGFIAIISAAGVYLNFAFGLIQRAVNMAVLYIMSPISISFFPFDDGAKFKQQFVTPFYKEAISAFAVIISLNIFTLLLEPIQEAVKAVTGNAMIGWLGLVAMVSMLPKVRETIQGVLGAGGLAQKSLGQMFNDAGKALGVDSAKKLYKKGVGAAGSLRQAVDKMKAFKKDRQDKKDAKKEAKLEDKQNKLKEKIEQGKKDGKSDSWIKRNQKKLDEKIKSADKLAEKKARATALADAYKSGDGSGITNKGDKKKFENMQKAAEKAAKKELLNSGVKKSDPEYAKKLREATNNKLNDERFRKSTNSVVKGMKIAGRAAAGLATLGGTELVRGGWKLANKSPLIAALIDNKLDALKDNKNSGLGEYLRYKDPLIRQKSRDEYRKKEIQKIADLNKYKEDSTKSLLKGSNESLQGDKVRDDYAWKQVAKNHLSSLGYKSKLKMMLMSQYVEDGLDESQAAKKVESICSKGLTEDQAKKMYISGSSKAGINGGGDDALANRIIKGDKFLKKSGIFDDTNPDIIKEFNDIKNKLINEKINLGTAQLEVQLNNATSNVSQTIEHLTERVATTIGHDSENDKKDITEIFERCSKNGNMSMDRALSEILNKFGSDKEGALRDVMFAERETYARLRSDDIAELSAALAASQAYDRSNKFISDNFGNFASPEDIKTALSALQNYQDTNLNSTNVNSCGYRIQHEVYEAGLQGDDAAKAISRIKKELGAIADNVVGNFNAKYANEIREYSTAKKFAEEKLAAEAIGTATAIQEQREFHVNVNMDTTDVQMIVNDGLIQKLHAEGKFDEGGYKLQQLINAIEAHDYTTANKLGFDENTVNQLKILEEKGEAKRLKSIKELGEFDAAFLSTSDSMGGSSLGGIGAVVGQLTRIAENKIIMDKLDIYINDNLGKESQCRNAVEYAMKKIATDFKVGGKEWNDLLNGKLGTLMTENGQAITTQQQLAEEVGNIVKQVHEGTLSRDNQRVKDMENALNAVKAANLDNVVIANTIDLFTQGIANGTLANQYAENARLGRIQKSETNAGTQEALKKMKPFGK